MSGLSISIIVVTAAFAVLAFLVAYILASTLGASKIASEKRMEELKKTEVESEVALVKSKKRESNRKQLESKSGFGVKLASKLYKQLQSADIKMRPEEFLLIWVLVAVVPAMMILLISPTFVTAAIVSVVIFSLLPYLFIRMKRKKRVKQFDVQLADALMIACSSLRSGLSFTQAMEAISKDMPAPISTEFGLVLSEMAMGMPMDEALERLNERIDSQYLPLMVSSILIQRQTGGNLSSILEGIAVSIQDKMKLKQELKASTASGKMTGLIVGFMPFAITGLLFFMNQEFIMPLFTTTIGKVCLGIALGLEFICFIVVRKIINIKM